MARQEAVNLARQWRNRRDSAPAYVKWAEQIQTELSIGSMKVESEALARAETFPAAETRLQGLIEEALLKRVTTSLLDLIRTRIDGFWSIQKPEIKTRWEVILNAGRVLQEAARIESALKGKQWTASKLFAEYVYGDQPWCSLDTAHRHFERDVQRYDLRPQQHEALQRLIAQASARYTDMVNRLAELFVPAYKDEDFTLADVPLQANIYRDYVAERVRRGRVAYILVDAFRFEMAREFAALLAATEPNWKVQLTPALATPPTITDVGMAALMPGAEDGIALTFERGALVPQIGGKNVRTAKARMERIKKAVGAEIVETTLDEIAPLRKWALSQLVAKARVVVVTASDDIDGLGENMPQKARHSLNEIFSLLRRGLATLAGSDIGITEIIVTADHGFILADPLDEGQKIDPPGGGSNSLLKRRVWIGVGGDSHPSTLRTPLSAFGIGGKLELVTPIGLAAFKVQGGNSAYFHGGLALQEVVIPVLTISAVGAAAEPSPVTLDWKLSIGSPKITSPFVSITIEAAASKLWAFEPPLVHVELRSGSQAVSEPVSATYGFDEVTKDVKLRVRDEAATIIEKNTVTVQLFEKSVTAVDAYVLNAATGAVLASLSNIPVSLNLFE
ncbi:MAG: PglZ domain-containing protein [Candidatus Flexifilum sp.]